MTPLGVSGMKVSALRPVARAALQPRRRLHSQTVTRAAKLISSSDIPAFIPRKDLMEQLWRWAEIEVAANGATNFGIQCSVEYLKREDVPWGFKINMQQDGQVVATLKMGFDEAVATKYAFIGRQDNGMPQTEGEATDVAGAHFEMWKVDENPVTSEIREAIRAICVALSAAMTRYYSFGSIFAEDL